VVSPESYDLKTAFSLLFAFSEVLEEARACTGVLPRGIMLIDVLLKAIVDTVVMRLT